MLALSLHVSHTLLKHAGFVPACVPNISKNRWLCLALQMCHPEFQRVPTECSFGTSALLSNRNSVLEVDRLYIDTPKLDGVPVWKHPPLPGYTVNLSHGSTNRTVRPLRPSEWIIQSMASVTRSRKRRVPSPAANSKMVGQRTYKETALCL